MGGEIARNQTESSRSIFRHDDRGYPRHFFVGLGVLGAKDCSKIDPGGPQNDPGGSKIDQKCSPEGSGRDPGGGRGVSGELFRVSGELLRALGRLSGSLGLIRDLIFKDPSET